MSKVKKSPSNPPVLPPEDKSTPIPVEAPKPVPPSTPSIDERLAAIASVLVDLSKRTAAVESRPSVGPSKPARKPRLVSDEVKAFVKEQGQKYQAYLKAGGLRIPAKRRDANGGIVNAAERAVARSAWEEYLRSGKIVGRRVLVDLEDKPKGTEPEEIDSALNKLGRLFGIAS